MSRNLGFGAAWLGVAAIYAALAIGSRQPASLALATAGGLVSVGVAVRFRAAWADERAKRINC